MSKKEKVEKFEPKTVDSVVPAIVPDIGTVQDSFRYGKNVEKLKASQVE